MQSSSLIIRQPLQILASFRSLRIELPTTAILLVLLASLLQTVAAQQTGERSIFAGAAKVEINPPLGETVVGSFKPFPATTIHDKLHARCLVLRNGPGAIGFVVCDNLGIPKSVFDEARKLIREETDFPADNIMMSATHTHSATRAATPKYAPILARGIADSVKQAIATLQPAKIGWSGVDEPSEVFNRRWRVSDPKLRANPFGGTDAVRMNPPRGHATLQEPAGPIDPEISILSVQSKSGRPIALLANYSLHYVGGVERGNISADYFGIFSETIGTRIGVTKEAQAKFVGLLSNGTSGDINNINFRDRSPSRKPYEKMTEVANLVAKRVAETYSSIKHHDWVPLGSARKEITLRVRKPNKAMQEYFAQARAKKEDEPKHHRYELVYADRVQKLLDGPDTITTPIQVVRIGDLAVAAIPFETFVEIGLEIKDRTPFQDAFTIELANDYHGYLPTPEQHKLGGYETWMGTNRVQKDASKIITKTVLELMNELKK